MNRRRFLAGTTACCLGGWPFPNEQTDWSATGTLLEACTCAVPCTCNFGQGPSPDHFCHTVYAYRLEKANWGTVDLSGLIVGGGEAEKGAIGFLDARATPEQRPLLEKLALALFAAGGPSSAKRRFVPVAIKHEVNGNVLWLAIAGYGGFTASVLLGRDGKNPIIVENNTIWPIPKAIKAKTTAFSLKDKAVGTIDATDTNANYGVFTLTGKG